MDRFEILKMVVDSLPKGAPNEEITYRFNLFVNLVLGPITREDKPKSNTGIFSPPIPWWYTQNQADDVRIKNT